ncbi:MAG: hypothetical protein LQ351_005541 [Letrouitia transgressa]|nr:MAG: hypothetical protein LQ351_005541 [Letrouitia transgressa]
MAGKSTISFDELIQADRQRRKDELLANALLGNGKRPSTPSNGVKKTSLGGGLASRIGIAKPLQRPTSATSKIRYNGVATSQNLSRVHNPLSRLNSSTRETSMGRQLKRERILEAAMSDSAQDGTTSQSKVQIPGEEISIRGIAGPYNVIGDNFAPGTTAADIKSAMSPSGGEMQNCRIIQTSPTVMAEMVFAERAHADNVIATFNNKRADGRIIHVYMKQVDAQNVPDPSPTQAPSEPRAPRVDLTKTEPKYDAQREQTDRNRRRAEPEYQDGRYGFESKGDRMDVDIEDRHSFRRDEPRNYGRSRDFVRPRDERRLYSDDVHTRPRGRGFR